MFPVSTGKVSARSPVYYLRSIDLYHRLAEGEEGLGYDSGSQSIIKLNNGMVLYLREVNKYLALVSLLRQENFDKHGLTLILCIFY